MNKHLLFFLALITLSYSAIANHFSGAYIRYEKTNTQNEYNVYLTLYKTCESSAIDLPTFTNVVLSSASKGVNNPINIPLVKNDTLQPYCPGTSTSCQNISSPNPGYIVGEYIGTFTIPSVSNDWKLVFANSSRNLGISNLQGASGYTFYIETAIDMNNNSAVVQDNPPHVLFINDTARIPLSYIDPDGDNVTIQLANPASGYNMGIPYANGYSFNQPLGSNGLCYIDSANNLVLKCPQVGKYTLALLIKEDRGGLPHSYSMMDFVVICTSPNSGGDISTPYPTVATKDIEIFTCPGKKNSITLNYSDLNPSDSIYLDIETPTLAGWTFNTTSNNGTGSASANISWTTPQALNPNSLKFFDFLIKARDNSCLINGEGTYVYRVQTRECTADSVWPGDANSDKVVNIYDPLAIALAYGDTGSVRSGANINWVGQVSLPWDGTILNNIDKKHSDCNGDGLVDTADLNAVAANYSKIHQRNRGQLKTTGVPDLYFDHTGISPNPDSTVSIKINLGTGANPIENFYGLGTNIQVTGLGLASTPSITYPSSWLGNTSNTLRFTHDISNTSVDWAYARTNKQNVATANGTLANINFTIPSTAVDGQLVKLYFNNTAIISSDGTQINAYNTLVDSFYIEKPSVINKHELLKTLSLYPNPTTSDLSLDVFSRQEDQAIIIITDISGRVIKNQSYQMQMGHNHYSIDVTDIQSGLYIMTIKTTSSGTTTRKWSKQ